MNSRTAMAVTARLVVASVWLYQGLWCKVLGRAASHREIVASVPWIGAELAGMLLLSIGIVEIVIAAWVLTGLHPFATAAVQTGLLAAMNTGGLIWARAHLEDPVWMIAANVVLLGVVWWLAWRRTPSSPADGGAGVDAASRRLQSARQAPTPWARGRLDDRGTSAELTFGWMYEDVEIEASVFPESSRVFCIASGGDTAMTLADRGRDVYAIDVNPAQIEYLRARLGWAPARAGRAERLLRRARQAAACLGLTTRHIETFLNLDDPATQVAYWNEYFDRSAVRLLLRSLLHPTLLRRAYADDFVQSLPSRFDAVMMRRLAAAFGRQSNRDNPYAWRLLLGRDLPAGHRRQFDKGRVHPVCADAVAFLRGCPAGLFDGFSLSNILDGAPPGYAAELWKAVDHAAAPGAVSVLRTLRPASGEAAKWAARDRSLIWGGIDVRCLGLARTRHASEHESNHVSHGGDRRSFIPEGWERLAGGFAQRHPRYGSRNDDLTPAGVTAAQVDHNKTLGNISENPEWPPASLGRSASITPLAPLRGAESRGLMNRGCRFAYTTM